MTAVEGKVEVIEDGGKAETENGNSTSIPSLDEKILKQVEFYFGDANLPHDKFIKLESANNDGWFPAELLLKFNKLINIINSVPEEERLKTIIAALQSSILVEVNEDSSKIRRNPEMPLPEGNAETKTVYLKGFNKMDTKLEQLIEHFGKYEGMERVIMRYYKEKLLQPSSVAPVTVAAAVEKKEGDTTEPAVDAPKPAVDPPKSTLSSLSSKIVWVKKFKGSIFVVFKTEEQAKAALADITTYAGHPLMKLMQPDYIAKKKKEYQERAEARNAKKRGNDGSDGSPAKKAKKDDDESEEEEKEKEDATKVGVLVKLSDIPDGIMRETIKDHWYNATGDKEKFDVGFVDFQRGDKVGVLRLSNEGAAPEALALDSLKDGTLALSDGASLKVALFSDEAEEREYSLKMQKDRQNFKSRSGRGGGRGGGGGRGRGGRGRGGRGRGRGGGRGRRN